MRTFSGAVTDLVEQRMRAICEGLGQAHGARLELEFVRRVGPVINTTHEANFAAEVMRKIVSEPNVPVQEPSMASEDFAYMLEAKAGCYAFIGNGHGDHRAIGHGDGPCMLHNPAYDFNDNVLPLGATYWVRLSEEWLATPR